MTQFYIVKQTYTFVLTNFRPQNLYSIISSLDTFNVVFNEKLLFLGVVKVMSCKKTITPLTKGFFVEKLDLDFILSYQEVIYIRCMCLCGLLATYTFKWFIYSCFDVWLLLSVNMCFYIKSRTYFSLKEKQMFHLLACNQIKPIRLPQKWASGKCV